MENTGKYVYNLYWRMIVGMEDEQRIRYEYLKFETRVLKWVAQTLEAEDVFLLSWPDSKDHLHILDNHALINAEELSNADFIVFDKALKLWLKNKEMQLSLNDTTQYPTLKSSGIRSLLITKIFINCDHLEGVEGFRPKDMHLLLCVCNRKSDGLGGMVFTSYDNSFCKSLAVPLLKVHYQSNFNPIWNSYKKFKNAFQTKDTVGHLQDLAMTTEALLDFYDRLHCTLPAFLLDDYLDSHIVLYTTKQISQEKLEKIAIYCQEQIRNKNVYGQEARLSYTLARGFFVLGIAQPENWQKGVDALKKREQVKSANCPELGIAMEIERSRVYWWLIYTKCRQMASEPSYLTDIEQLYQYCLDVCGITSNILRSFLKKDKHFDNFAETKNNNIIPISSEWLWLYFGYRFLESDILNCFFKKQNPTLQEQAEFYQRLSIYILPLLNSLKMNVVQKIEQANIPGMKKNNPPLELLEGINYYQFVRAMFYLISEYCHQVIDLPRELDVETHLLKAVDVDATLYLSKGWYRDHVFHVIDVCLLGWFLLECRLTDGRMLLECLKSRGKKDSVDDLIRNWFLAALYHDIGYSLDVKEQKVKAKKDEKGEHSPELDQNTLKEIEQVNALIVIKQHNIAQLEIRKAKYTALDVPLYVINELEGELEEIKQLAARRDTLRASHISQSYDEAEPEAFDSLGYDHGEQSAQHVINILKFLPSEYLSKFEPAIQAIRKHTRMAENVDALVDPLSFLLILCDELQDWNRPRVDHHKVREGLETQIIFSDVEPLPTRKMMDYLLLHTEWDDQNKSWTIPENHLSFNMKYKDADDGQFQPIAIWLLKTYNLQRLHVDEDLLNITINLIHPTSREFQKSNLLDAFEFSILRDFMRDHKRWRELRNWIENDKAIQWSLETDNNKIVTEKLVLSLNRLAGQKLLHDDPSKFLIELIQYRQDCINGKKREL